MRVWLAEVGEILPVDPDARLMRTGILAEQLVKRKHEVVWWADAFNHLRKVSRAPANATVALAANFSLELLHGPAYRRNISFARLRNQRIVAEQFRKLAPAREPPDVIYCGYPTIELALEVTRFAAARRIPVVVDVRDPWPELLVKYAPPGLQWAGRIALSRYFRMGRETLRSATALASMSEPLLRWALEFCGRLRNPLDQVYYLAYEPQEGGDEEPVALGDDSDVRLRCLFVGGFGPAYDLLTITGAARRLEQKGVSGIQFVIAGDGLQMPALRKQVQGLKNVILPGWVGARQIRYLLSRSHVGLVAISPLAISAVPNKSFEYMSGGLAILNTTTADLHTIVESEGVGLNYRAGDASGLAGKLESLLADPEMLQAMRARARAVFERRFEAGKVYRDFAEKLEALGKAAHERAGASE